MATWIRALAVGALTLGLVACGETAEEKAQDRAKSMGDLYNSIYLDLVTSGTPTSNWSDESIDEYERKLNRLEDLGLALKDSNGKNGVVITGGNNERFLREGRSAIANARAEKARQFSMDDTASKAAALDAEGKRLGLRFAALGMPNETWSDEKLNDYIEVLQQIQSNNEQKLANLNEPSSSPTFQDAQKIRADVNNQKAATERLIQRAQELLAKKRAA